MCVTKKRSNSFENNDVFTIYVLKKILLYNTFFGICSLFVDGKYVCVFRKCVFATKETTRRLAMQCDYKVKPQIL